VKRNFTFGAIVGPLALAHSDPDTASMDLA